MKTYRLTVDVPASSPDEARNFILKVSDKFTEETQTGDTKLPSGRTRYLGNTAISLIAVTECMEGVGMYSVRSGDPVLPLLTQLTEEHLAFCRTQPVNIAPPGWELPEGNWDEHTTDCWIDVKRGDPLYPGPDQSHMPGAMTGREMAALAAYSQFMCAMEILKTFSQYLPDLIIKGETEGMIEFNVDALRQVLTGFLGWPGKWCESKYNLSAVKIWAITWWAFKKSDYWPKRLTSLDELIKAFPTIADQYDRYYAEKPEGKRPHDLYIGKPAT